MSLFPRFVLSLVLVAAFLSTALPCGPGYTTPLFDTGSAPENPYTDFAAGSLGILKPKFRRSVLYAAYRYINGSGLNALEQKAVVEVWKAEINNKDFRDNSVETALKAWIAKRTSVVEDEEKTPDIYVERSYGGYDFFPNCTKNAFETATETLSDRVSSRGASNPNVLNWIMAQDQVFENCASGKRTPDPAPPGAPEWLQQDREYQLAAASFYSLDYADSKRRFAAIAQDTGSPWQETADYLVARTLIRQASLSKPREKADQLYDEAEAHLARFTSSSGKFTESARGLAGLIKYRRHPRQRVSELAKQLTFSGGSDGLRQDLIDYTWLMDKFESEAMAAEEKRKRAAELAAANATTMNANTVSGNTNAAVPVRDNENKITIRLSTEDYSQNWVIYIDRNATDEEALAAAERVVGSPLTDELKDSVRHLRRIGYTGRFSDSQQTSYEGSYHGDEKLTPSLMPDFLKQDELTDWLFTFQMNSSEAYLYSLRRFRETGSELWLMTALTKANVSSMDLPRLLNAANNTRRTSPAFTTIAYHTARILIAQGKPAEARKLVEDMLNAGDQLPVSARNSFLDFKLRFVSTLEDFLATSLRRPFAFDFSGRKGTIEEFIEDQKAWYDPKYNTQGREAYEAEIEDNFKIEREWSGRMLFDRSTIELFNQHFPTASLIEVLRSPALPDYLRERFAVAVWTRAYLLNDRLTIEKVTPDLVRYRPEFGPYLTARTEARTAASRDAANLHFILKNPLLSPYIEDGTGKSDNEFGPFDSNDWWCEPYDLQYNDETNSEEPKPVPVRPAFLTAVQGQEAQLQRKRLKAIGDAPQYLGDKVLAWAKASPADPRVPEALYIMAGANGWNKYGCGSNNELRVQLADHLKRRYPNSEWTAKLISEEASE